MFNSSQTRGDKFGDPDQDATFGSPNFPQTLAGSTYSNFEQVVLRFLN